MSGRLAIVERDGMRYGIVSETRYDDTCHRLPCFSPIELGLLRQHAVRSGCQLPIPTEVLRAILAVKTAFPEARIGEYGLPAEIARRGLDRQNADASTHGPVAAAGSDSRGRGSADSRDPARAAEARRLARNLQLTLPTG